MRLALLVASCLAEELCHEPLVLLPRPCTERLCDVRIA